jgi:hypothetical protein
MRPVLQYLCYRSIIGVGVDIGIGIGIEGQKNATRKALLDRIVAMLTKLGQRGYTVREDKPQYTVGIDTDPDSDPDTDGNQEQTDRQQLAPGDGRAA